MAQPNRTLRTCLLVGASFLICLAGYGLFELAFSEPLKLLVPHQQVSVQGKQKIRLEFEVAARVDVEVTHIESSCDCVSFGEFPQKIAKGERRKIVAEVDLSKIESFPAQRTFVFYTNPICDRRPVAVIEFLDK